MQENTTNRNWTTLRTRAGLLACTLFAGAAFLACGEDAPVAANSGSDEDSAAAYAALSATLESCDEQLDACTAQAGKDPTALAACDTQAMSCKQKAESAEQHAQSCLKHDADRCKKHGGDDAGTDDGGTGDMHGCLGKRAPKLPKCVKELLGCLDEAGVRKRDATVKEIGMCLAAAHTCFKDELQKQREARRAEREAKKHQGAAGSAPHTDAGSGGAAVKPVAAGSGGSGGSAAPARPSILPPWWKH